jgi:hypothetical protein
MARRSGTGERGQTTTEYLMIAGLFTVITIILLQWMYPGWRGTLQSVANCAINREWCQ